MSEVLSSGTLSDLAIINPDKASSIRGLERFRYVDISCLSESGIADAESIPIIRAEAAPSRAQRLVKTGDSLVGTVRPERGARGIVGTDLDGEVASSGICVLRPKLASDAVFIYAVIRDPLFTEWCELLNRHQLPGSRSSGYRALPASTAIFGRKAEDCRLDRCA